jgi:hypothetical protein
MGDLPIRNPGQKTGAVAESILSAVLSRFSNVVPIPGGKDFGIDFYCELIGLGCVKVKSRC